MHVPIFLLQRAVEIITGEYNGTGNRKIMVKGVDYILQPNLQNFNLFAGISCHINIHVQ